MGKATTRVVLVPRWLTAALLLLVSIGMAALILELSGRAYLHERTSVVEVLSLVRRYDRLTPTAFIAGIAPVITNILFFIPWGVLAFFAFDSRRRLLTYALTLAVGVAFACLLVAWQSALPTRITGWNDAAWNTVGCAAGAVAAHVRKQLRMRFE
ncbi:MAG TPA: VanZ family protein [Thermoanaerobaculia bacterium]|nr:VanZ family protein [Thermoanaerobaculia bacterium]